MSEALPTAPAGGYDTTLLAADQIVPGKTYWVAHAIQLANGQLLDVGKRIPKLFDDPAYCPRLIQELAKKGGVRPEEYGKPVVVALVRVIQPGDARDAQLPTTTEGPDMPTKKQRRFLVVRPGWRGDLWRFCIEHGDYSDRYDASDKKTQIDRCELPHDFHGSIAEAQAWWMKNRKPQVVPEEKPSP